MAIMSESSFVNISDNEITQQGQHIYKTSKKGIHCSAAVVFIRKEPVNKFCVSANQLSKRKFYTNLNLTAIHFGVCCHIKSRCWHDKQSKIWGRHLNVEIWCFFLWTTTTTTNDRTDYFIPCACKNCAIGGVTKKNLHICYNHIAGMINAASVT